MCVLGRCCFCIPLRLGAFIVAVVYIVFAAVGVVQYIGIYPANSTPELLVAHLAFSVIFLLAAIWLFLGVLRALLEKRLVMDGQVAIEHEDTVPNPELLIANLVFSVIFLVSAIMLFLGVVWEDSNLLQPWIWFMMFILVIYAVLLIVYIVQLLNLHKDSGVSSIAILAVNLCAELYCLLVVYSYDHTIYA